MNLVGNIISKERTENISNSSIWVKPQSNWQTGTPTEVGWYIVVENNSDKTYEEMYWNGTVFDYYGITVHHYEVKAWQRIEPYKEASE